VYVLAAAFCYASLLAAAPWSNAYLIHYGSFPLSRGEFALKLHLLIFILPATIFLSLALAEARPRQLVASFDGLGACRRVRVAPILLALFVFGVVMAVRVYVLRESVVTDDENVYHFQARLLASGRLYAPSTPEAVRAFFDNQYIVNNGRWFGLYFLGHPAMLALALKIGLAQWVGAIEAALIVLLAVGIARRAFNERVGLLAGVLLALSPFFIFVSATHLSQPTSTLFFTSFMYCALRIVQSLRTARWWLLGAATLVVAVFTRPQTGILLSLPFLARITWSALKGSMRPGWGTWAGTVAILAAGAAGFFAVNHALTGSVLKTGYQAWMAQGHEWEFPWGPAYVVREISQNLAQLNFWLLGWPLSLAFVAFFERTPTSWMLAAVPIIALSWYGLLARPTVAAVGPVYYTETIVPLVILTASGLERVILFLQRHVGNVPQTRAAIAAPVAGALACLFAFAPFEVASLRLMADVTQAPYDLVEARGLNHAVVFVRSLPAQHVSPGSWAYYHRNNSPDLDDPVLFVRDLGPERNKVLMRYLADRSPYWMGMIDGRLVLRPIDR
jgi:hypothetical protein